jgi:hypothetical protein
VFFVVALNGEDSDGHCMSVSANCEAVERGKFFPLVWSDLSCLSCRLPFEAR